MKVPITQFWLAWNPKQKVGYITLKLQYGQQIRLDVKSAEEFTAIGMILNESPVVWDSDAEVITTGWEEVGGT